jgi:16S rRNA (cytosine967-C5)-methyltransferase
MFKVSLRLKNKNILDACAAPGGKTVQIADLMGNSGAIMALDVNNRRLTALSNHLERCHIGSVVVYNLDARRATGLNLKFDRILLDVPARVISHLILNGLAEEP